MGRDEHLENQAGGLLINPQLGFGGREGVKEGFCVKVWKHKVEKKKCANLYYGI